MRSDTQTIIGALRVLARDIQTDDGVVNACLEEAAQRLGELDGWKSAADTLPASALAVLAVVDDGARQPFVIRAMYVAPHTLEPQPGYYDDCDYDQTTDTYYCKSGWYEANYFEDVHWDVDGLVTHWKPLPSPPTK